MRDQVDVVLGAVAAVFTRNQCLPDMVMAVTVSTHLTITAINVQPPAPLTRRRRSGVRVTRQRCRHLSVRWHHRNAAAHQVTGSKLGVHLWQFVERERRDLSFEESRLSKLDHFVDIATV